MLHLTDVNLKKGPSHMSGALFLERTQVDSMAGGTGASNKPGPWGPLTRRLPRTEQRGLSVRHVVALGLQLGVCWDGSVSLAQTVRPGEVGLAR